MSSSSATRAALPVAAAIAANVAVFAVGKAADASFVVAGRNAGDAPMEIGVAAVVFASLLPLVIGVVLTAWAARRRPTAARRLRMAAGVLTVVSLAAPLTADTDGGTRAALALMHLVVGAGYLVATRRTATASVASGPLTAEAVVSSR